MSVVARKRASDEWYPYVPSWGVRYWLQQETLADFRAVKPALLDTGVIVALLDRSEQFHQACSETVRNLEAPLVTCEAVIAESCYLLRNLPGAPEAVI